MSVGENLSLLNSTDFVWLGHDCNYYPTPQFKHVFWVLKRFVLLSHLDGPF